MQPGRCVIRRITGTLLQSTMRLPAATAAACHDEATFDLVADPCAGCHELYDPADTIAPVTTSDALANYSGAARVTFSVTDGGKTGVARTFYRLDGGATTAGDSLLVAEGGDHTIEFWSVDQNRNEETPHNTVSFSNTTDTVAPVTVSDVKAEYEGPAVIGLSAMDTSTLGVRSTYYRLDGGPTVEGTSILVMPPAIGQDAHTLEFWSDDYSGNVEATQTASFTVTPDLTAPVTTSDVIGGNSYIGAQVFTLSASDGNGTGVCRDEVPAGRRLVDCRHRGPCSRSG